MTSLGRFFDFRMSPNDNHRLDWFKTGDTALVQGCPVRRPTATTAVDTIDGRIAVEKVAAGVGPILGAESGILVCEMPWPNVTQTVAPITRSSDFDTAPANTPIQVVHGEEVQVVFSNLSAAALAFEDQATYSGRNMVLPSDLAGMAIGKLLTVGAGDDTNGYYKVTATASEAWFRVVDFEVIDDDQAFVAAQMLF